MTTDIPIRRYFEIRFFEPRRMSRHKQNTVSSITVDLNSIKHTILRGTFPHFCSEYSLFFVDYRYRMVSEKGDIMTTEAKRRINYLLLGSIMNGHPSNDIRQILKQGRGIFQKKHYTEALNQTDYSLGSRKYRKEIAFDIFLEALYNDKLPSKSLLRDVFGTTSVNKIIEMISIQYPRRRVLREYANNIRFPETYVHRPYWIYEVETDTPLEKLKQQMINEEMGIRRAFEQYNFREPGIEEIIRNFTGFGKSLRK